MPSHRRSLTAVSWNRLVALSLRLLIPAVLAQGGAAQTFVPDSAPLNAQPAFPSAYPIYVIRPEVPTTDTLRLAESLAARGLPVVQKTLSQLAKSPAEIHSPTLWVGAHLKQIRATGLAAVVKHLEAGGGLLVLGEPPFQQKMYPSGGQLVPEERYLAQAVKPEVAFRQADYPPHRFHVATDCPEAGSTVTLEQAELPERGSSTVLHGSIPMLEQWTCFGTTVSATMPKGQVTTFWAKGTHSTDQLAVEWKERDGSRWIAKVYLKPEWQYYALKPEEFVFWHDAQAKGRGGTGDKVNPQNAQNLSIGLALTHTRVGGGPHEFWIGDLGLASISDPKILELLSLPMIDGLYPLDMVYPMRPARLEVGEPYASVTTESLPLPERAWSSYWRPMGSGLDKNRRCRYIPIVTALNNDNTRAGALAAITLHFKEPYPNAVYGYVSVESDELLTSPGWLDLIAMMADRMNRRTFFSEAGSSEFTYDIRDLNQEKIRIGARVAEWPGERRRHGPASILADPAGGSSRSGLQDAGVGRLDGEVRGGLDPRLSQRPLQISLSVAGETTTSQNESGTYSFDRYEAVEHPSGAFLGYDIATGSRRDPLKFRAALFEGETLVDIIEQEIRFDGPRKNPKFLTARNRQFYRQGKPWRAFGVNYMPSSGLALVDKGEFEHWINDSSYDPAIVEQELARIRQMGMNMISVFIYRDSADTGNLLDLLSRARDHGLLVNVSLRPNFPPWPAEPEVLQTLVKKYRLDEKDEVMAYDVAWEPWWGGEGVRAAQGASWVKWVEKKHGSAAKAFEVWQFQPKGKLEEFPADHQLRYDGPWRSAVIDYRKFVDETLHAAYFRARIALRKIDPNHLISFRQSEGANPYADPGYYAIPLESVAKAVDFFSPEAYGIGSDDEKARRTMAFAASYSQAVAPGKPVIWAEYGSTVWSGNAFAPSTLLLQRQADTFRRILRGAEDSRSAGTVAWWFPGGFRRYEDSDYGLINPDGTERLVGSVLREYAERAVAAPPAVRWEPTLPVEPKPRVRGYVGLFEELRSQFDALTTTATLPLLKLP